MKTRTKFLRLTLALVIVTASAYWLYRDHYYGPHPEILKDTNIVYDPEYKTYRDRYPQRVSPDDNVTNVSPAPPK
jgi:hypothetical protein